MSVLEWHADYFKASSNLSGFLVQSFSNGVLSSLPMRLVDLGECESTGTCELYNVRAAWSYWRGSHQWQILRSEDRIFLIEGQPDRYPNPGELAEQWLEGRSGSFRGFEIAGDRATRRTRVRIFSDPLCTRPVYYLASDECVCIADKLSTIVLNATGTLQPDWGGLLEGALLGSLYSHKTTVKGAVWVAPGEMVEFHGSDIVRRWKNALPPDSDLTQSEVMANPAETLRLAIEKAVNETWTESAISLLLSGGLDSRILLTLASGKRKTLTVELYSGEAEIAKQVASAAGSDLDVVPAPDYEFPMKWAYLVTGAMHDSKFVTHLGQVKDWRRRGITGITHGYFHNTLYRGWTASPQVRKPHQTSFLFKLMGDNAYYFDRYGCRQQDCHRQLYELLSSDGKALLSSQLHELSDSLAPVFVDGFDLTFERRLMEFVSRQVFFCVMLGWYEALDVVSPVFQPVLWTWYALSSPRHRHRDWAIRQVFLSLDHPAAKIPDSNTGGPIAHLKPDWRDHIRNRFWYSAVRTAYRRLFWKPVPYREEGMCWGERFRKPATLVPIEEGVHILRDNPLFDGAKVDVALDAYRKGENQLVDTIGGLMALGQWQGFVSRPELQTEHVKVLYSGSPV